jgi:DNA-binding response OmpR family regulator
MNKPIALIVEDDPQLNNIFSISLKNNFEIKSCLDGNDALQQLTKITPAIVILDLNLPGVSGTQILDHIRANSQFAKTRVIIATADERTANDLEHKADLILLKPISPIQLGTLASRFID